MATRRAFANTVLRSWYMTSSLSSARICTGWHDSNSLAPWVPSSAGRNTSAPAFLNCARLISFAKEPADLPVKYGPQAKDGKVYLGLQEKDYKDVLAVLEKGGQVGAYDTLNAARLPDNVALLRVPRSLTLEEIIELRKKPLIFPSGVTLPPEVGDQMRRELRRMRGRGTDDEEEEEEEEDEVVAAEEQDKLGR